MKFDEIDFDDNSVLSIIEKKDSLRSTYGLINGLGEVIIKPTCPNYRSISRINKVIKLKEGYYKVISFQDGEFKCGLYDINLAYLTEIKYKDIEVYDNLIYLDGEVYKPSYQIDEMNSEYFLLPSDIKESSKQVINEKIVILLKDDKIIGFYDNQFNYLLKCDATRYEINENVLTLYYKINNSLYETVNIYNLNKGLFLKVPISSCVISSQFNGIIYLNNVILIKDAFRQNKFLVYDLLTGQIIYKGNNCLVKYDIDNEIYIPQVYFKIINSRYLLLYKLSSGILSSLKDNPWFKSKLVIENFNIREITYDYNDFVPLKKIIEEIIKFPIAFTVYDTVLNLEVGEFIDYEVNDSIINFISLDESENKRLQLK